MDLDDINMILIENISKSAKLAKILNEIMTNYGIPKEAYIILGSYAIREFREISDLDVDMDQNYFSKLEICKLGTVSLRGEEYVWAFNYTFDGISYIIEVYATDPYKNYPNDSFSITNLHLRNALDKDEYTQNCYKLETLLEWKQIANRKKDQSDIELIKKILKID